MRTTLNVPFAEKDDARRLGASWDVARRVWYVENVEDLRPFMRWINAAQQRPCEPAQRFPGNADARYRAGEGLKDCLPFVFGSKLVVVWDQRWRPLDVASVVEIRRDGKAKLSNGWIVDKNGVLEGTRSRPGGRIGG